MTENRTARDVVIRTAEAMSKLDITGISGGFAEDIVWEVVGGEYFEPGDSWTGGHRWTGRETVISDVIGGLGKIFDFDAPFTMEVTAVHGDGPSIPVEFRMSATTVRGRPYVNYYCMVFTVTDGRITHLREYTNTLRQKQVLIDDQD